MHIQMQRLYAAASELRKVNGQSAVATLLGQSPQTLHNWESRGISKSGLLLAQKGIGCDASWLESGVGSMALSPDANVQPVAPRHMVPLISNVQAGAWTETVDLYAPGQADEWHPVNRKVDRSAFALRITGDSMEPDFVEGGVVVIDPEQQPKPGDYCVAKLIDVQAATFKKLMVDAGQFWLIPLNKMYPPIRIVENVRIIGRAVQYDPPSRKL